MATVQSVIDEARWDLTDYDAGVKWKDDELVVYMNRAIRSLNSELCRRKSDLVYEEETSTNTVASQNYVDISGLSYDSVVCVWIGSDQLEQTSIQDIYYKRKFRSGDAYPNYWSIEDDTIIFESTCDAIHTDLVIGYYTKASDVTASSNMPYSDIFNDSLRDAVVEMAIARKGDQSERTDKKWIGMLRTAANEEQLRRSFVPKPYYIDF